MKYVGIIFATTGDEAARIAGTVGSASEDVVKAVGSAESATDDVVRAVGSGVDDGIKIEIPGPVNSPQGKIDYLMGRVTGNPDSVSKGKFFEGIMGFDDASLDAALRNQVKSNLPSAVSTTTSNGNSAINITSEIVSPTGYKAKILSSWEVLPDGTYKFITAYPN